jgi:hypothetical protein
MCRCEIPSSGVNEVTVDSFTLVIGGCEEGGTFFALFFEVVLIFNLRVDFLGVILLPLVFDNKEGGSVDVGGGGGVDVE